MSFCVDHHISGCEYFGRYSYICPFPPSQQNLVSMTALQLLESWRCGVAARMITLQIVSCFHSVLPIAVRQILNALKMSPDNIPHPRSTLIALFI